MNTLNATSCNAPAVAFDGNYGLEGSPAPSATVKPIETVLPGPCQTGNLPAELTPTTGNICPLPSLMRDSANLSVDKQRNEITTAGGYKIQATGKDNQVVITTPEGKKIDIWGDPHVKTSDGTEFQIMDDSTIQLKDGTVVALDNERAGGKADGPTTVKDVTVFSANGQYSRITGIDQNQPQVSDARQTPEGFSLGASFKADDAYVLTGDESGLAQLNSGRKITGSRDNGAIQTFGEVVNTASPSFAERAGGLGRPGGNNRSLSGSLCSAMDALKSLVSSLSAEPQHNHGPGEINRFVFHPPCGRSDDRGASSDILNALLKLIGQMLSLISSLLEANNQSSLVRFNQLSV
jgi:Domain of Unknown Function (DUF1521)